MKLFKRGNEMKNCVYPLVVYADKEENCYIGLFPDLDITASGDTIEETYLSSIENLKMFLDFAAKMESDISSPSTYIETVGLNPKRVVLLTMVEVDVDNLVLTNEEKSYKNFLSAMLVND